MNGLIVIWIFELAVETTNLLLQSFILINFTSKIISQIVLDALLLSQSPFNLLNLKFLRRYIVNHQVVSETLFFDISTNNIIWIFNVSSYF